MAWLIVPVIALTGCSASTPAASPQPTTQPTTPSPVLPPMPTVPTSAATSSAAGACQYLPSGQAAKPVNPPSTADVAQTGTVAFTMHLTAGDVLITLDRAKAPCAVNSFASLVAQTYYDNTDCHRLVQGFVLQCGDPTGTGTGGPGYSYADELTGKETYSRGTVAMANAGPDTNGSQFFIVLADAQLPPSYDVLGSVSPESMTVIDAIAAKGYDPNHPVTSQGGWPAGGAHIDSITAS